MTQKEIIYGIIEEVLHLDPAFFTLTGDMSYDDVPGWTSIGHMSIVSELEFRFNIRFTLDEIINLNSVDAICQIVHEKTKNE